MSEELSNALISLSSATDIKIIKPGKALPTVQKKDIVHIPAVKAGFVRTFPSFYELNNVNEIDPRTRQRVKEKETFTRFFQPAGSDKTPIFTTKEVYFIPLEFKIARDLYVSAYNPNVLKAPDCQSENGIIPQTPKFAKSCAECKYSKWEGDTPPACNEKPELLVLDMTAKTIKDPVLAAAVTAEAVILSFKKSAIKAVKELMKKLAEPVLFEDGSYSAVDMTQHLVKVTLQTAINKDGKEATYCIPTFEIVGQVPFDVSEQLIKAIHTPSPLQGNKTPLELFIGKTDIPANLDQGDSSSIPVSAVPSNPTPNVMTKEEVEKEFDEVFPETKPVVETVVEKPKPTPKSTPKPKPAPSATENLTPSVSAPTEEEDVDEVVF